MRNIKLMLCCFAILLLLPHYMGASEIWRNNSYTYEERAADLLSKLTLEEKTELMRYDSPAIKRLGINPYNWWNECLHGVARAGRATVFPQAIGLAAMWDRKHMFDVANAISDEARAKYHDFQRQKKYGIYQGLTFWTPNINIFRDPRWGRGMETYGEDPFLTAEMAIPFIKGLQGNDPRYLKLVATVKHFAVHSGPESTRHSADVWPSAFDMAETYLPHFERTVKEGGAWSVMCAYQRLNGAPCCGSQYLENILRNEWNFKGYIVSDCWAIRDFYDPKGHNLVATPEEASAMAIKAGTDLNCGSVYAASLLKAVKMGLVSEAEIDRSVLRLLDARLRLGEFDPQNEVPFSKIPLSIVDGEAHNALALETAHKSMVLLQNRNNTLPFSKSVKRVAVIGPNADNMDILLGNYHGFSRNKTTPLDGIRAKLPNADVKFAQGCRLADELPYLKPIPADYFFTDKSKKTKGLQAEYFDGKNFSGKLRQRRVDSNIDFVWWDKAPFKNMNAREFSVRWKGVFVPPVSGKYAIGGEGFTAFDIYFDGKHLIHGRTSDHDPRREYEFVELEAGRAYDVIFAYPENNSEYAVARMLWDMPNPNLKNEALALAAASDVVILCMGLSPMLEGEEMKVKVPDFDSGDRIDIQLPASQRELISEIRKLGKPTVLVLLNGSAVSLSDDALALPAILEAWYPGQAGGTAIADVLFGDYNPSGRLPVTFYKSVAQLPAFDDYDMQGKTYRYFGGTPLFPFGHGLSYTSFNYAWKNKPTNIKAGETLKVEFTVTNTGKVDGEEVVQLYVAHPDFPERKAIRSLQGFERVFLKAGESKTMSFELTPAQMAVRDSDNAQVVTPGNLLLSIGGAQPDVLTITNKTVVTTNIELKGTQFVVR